MEHAGVGIPVPVAPHAHEPVKGANRHRHTLGELWHSVGAGAAKCFRQVNETTDRDGVVDARVVEPVADREIRHECLGRAADAAQACEAANRLHRRSLRQQVGARRHHVPVRGEDEEVAHNDRSQGDRRGVGAEGASASEGKDDRERPRCRSRGEDLGDSDGGGAGCEVCQ